jgi:adenine C2-methylase RlmN of 23S rRNA A2503 and tRNA A37
MMADERCFGLSRRQVSISTVGVVPRILSLPDDLPVGVG